LASTAKPNPNYCFECAKCCITHPCALEPDDLGKIASYLNLSEGEVFSRFLMLDYVQTEGRKQYYVCPARKTGVSGIVVNLSWTLSDSPCIFLNEGRCRIQVVKPKGGMNYYCRLLTNGTQGIVGYGKKRAASDWAKSPVLKRLLTAANDSSSRSLPDTSVDSRGAPFFRGMKKVALQTLAKQLRNMEE